MELFFLSLHTLGGKTGVPPTTSTGQGPGVRLARADPDFALFVRCDGQGARSWPVLVGGSLPDMEPSTDGVGGTGIWFCFLSRVGLGWVWKIGASLTGRIDDDGCA